MDQITRVEPRGITLSDLMVVVAGVAIGYGLGPISMEPSIAWNLNGILTVFYISLIPQNRHVYIAAFAIALAVIVRRARYGGWPRVGDWPALVVASHLPSRVVLSRAYEIAFPDGIVNEWEAARPYWRPDQWPWAADWSLAAVIGLVLLARFRTRLPGWAGAIGIMAVATMLLCGPVHVTAESYDVSKIISRIVGPAPIMSGWGSFLSYAYFQHLFLWPEWLLYGLSTMAAVFDLRQSGPRSRFWTEWASLALMAALAAFYCLHYLFPDLTNLRTLLGVMVRGLLLVGVALASWLIIKVFTVFRNRRPAIRSLQFHEKGDRVE